MAAFPAFVPDSSTRCLRLGFARAPFARRVLVAAVAAVCTWLSAGCDGADSRAGGRQAVQVTSGGVGAVDWRRCRVGGVGNARCTEVSVPLDHADTGAAGTRIEIAVAILPALAAAPEPDPLVIFAGGPGQSAIDVGPLLDPLVPEVRKRRDIVLVDQRGTGRSHPLRCDPQTGSILEAPDGEDELRRAFDPAIRMEALDACLEAYDVSPEFFDTMQAVEDLEAVRRAAGYGRLNLYGASYGTRAALAYLRAHPDAVRSVVLDGVAPFDMGLPTSTGRDGQRALELAAEACAENEACRARYPELAERVHALLEGLENPRTVTVEHPRTGAPTQLEVERDGVAAVLHAALYSPTTAALVPLAVRAAMDGDWGPMAALATARGGGADIFFGMFLSVICAEDVPRAASQDLDAAFAGSFLSSRLVTELRAACERWPSAPVPEDYYAPVRADQPALVLSGDLDPVTPPRWGASVLEGLSGSQHLVVPGLGHGTWQNPCVARVIADFIAAPGELEVPACLDEVRRPPFFVGKAGPALGGGEAP